MYSYCERRVNLVSVSVPGPCQFSWVASAGSLSWANCEQPPGQDQACPGVSAAGSKQNEQVALGERGDLQVGGNQGDVEAVEVVRLVRRMKRQLERDALGFDEVVSAAVPAVCCIECLVGHGAQRGYDGLLRLVDARDRQRVRHRRIADAVPGRRLHEEVEIGVGGLSNVGLVGGILLDDAARQRGVHAGQTGVVVVHGLLLPGRLDGVPSALEVSVERPWCQCQCQDGTNFRSETCGAFVTPLAQKYTN